MRWEAGESNSSAVRMLAWLFNDPNETHDAFYWRERALSAEHTIRKMRGIVTEYDEDGLPGRRVNGRLDGA
jgi:hypothetical protein